jgi:hypothetical protein
MQRFLSVISKTVIAVGLLGFAAIQLPLAHSQAISTNGGSIQGTVTDPSGAVIPNVTVIIANPATGYSHTMTTDSKGFYALGPLNPGSYTISVSAPNFAHEVVTTIVETGTATSGNVKLILGAQNETIFRLTVRMAARRASSLTAKTSPTRPWERRSSMCLQARSASFS